MPVSYRKPLSSLVIGVFAVATFVRLPSPALATSPTITGPSSHTGASGEMAIPGVHINGTGTDTIPVKLSVTTGILHLTTDTGLTFTGDTTGSSIAFSGTINDINADLASLVYTNYAAGTDSLIVAIEDPEQNYYPANGHTYEYIPHALSWNDAEAEAKTLSINGHVGYLATITSKGENDFAASRLGGVGWLGASDAEEEGVWAWGEGPENGQGFWNGGTGGSHVGDAYVNWHGGQPDNYLNEDCLQFGVVNNPTTDWNDYLCWASLNGYMAEFDTVPGSIATMEMALTITTSTRHISTCPELQDIDTIHATKADTFVLDHDVDCDGYDFRPLDWGDSFEGTFDGKGHSISHLTIDAEGNAGLFAKASGAVIQNVTIASGLISGSNNVGGFVGDGRDLSFHNVHNNADVVSGNEVGGIVGDLYGTTDQSITDSSVTGDVNGSGEVGGIAGYLEYDGSVFTMSRTFTTGSVSSTGGNVGGLVGDLESYWDIGKGSQAILEDVYTRGNITASSSAGGLVGVTYMEGNDDFVTNIIIRRAYASGDVNSADMSGGLVGLIDGVYHPNDDEIITNSFAAGAVVSSEDETTQGALVGRQDLNDHPMVSTNNFYDQTRTGLSVCAGRHEIDCTAANVGGAATNYFKDNHVNAPLDTWNFSTVWRRNVADYPTLFPADDGDNVTAATENAAPNSGDANNDGQADSTQANVTSFVDPVTGHYAVLEVSGACSNQSSSSEAESAKTVADSGYDYPAGLMAFTTDCGTPGYTTAVTQYFYGVNPAGLILRKYNPTTHGYSTVTGATISSVTIAGTQVAKVVYSVTDGGTLDQDGTANGVIVDPAGLARVAVAVPNTGFGLR